MIFPKFNFSQNAAMSVIGGVQGSWSGQEFINPL
jgi:hypothetical protein